MTKLPENRNPKLDNDSRVVLYVKLKPENKEWIEKTAAEQKFESTTSFVEALIETLRAETGKPTKKSKAA
jgi:hypothetical protein